MRFYKAFAVILVPVFVASLLLLAQTYLQFSRLQADMRYANDVTSRFDREQETASRGTIKEAADSLWVLHFPSYEWPDKPEPFEGALARIVERQRRMSVRAVISELQRKTGEDLGSDPESWIMKHGSDLSREQLTAMREEAGRSAGNGILRRDGTQNGIRQLRDETNRTSTTSGSVR